MASQHAPRGPVKAKGNPMEGADPMKARCTATNRQGRRCGKAPIVGGFVCRMHGGAAPQVEAAARDRLAALFPESVQVLAALLRRDEYPTVQFQAARFVAEQEVGKAKESVAVDLKTSVGELSDDELRARAEKALEALRVSR